VVDLDFQAEADRAFHLHAVTAHRDHIHLADQDIAQLLVGLINQQAIRGHLLIQRQGKAIQHIPQKYITIIQADTVEEEAASGAALWEDI